MFEMSFEFLSFRLTMSITRIAPLAKTMAFGGVAKRAQTIFENLTDSFLPIGSINAKETASVQGRMRKAG